MEREDTSYPLQRVRGFSWRWPVMIVALLGLLVLNVATLFSASVHDRLFDVAVKGLNYLGADVAERVVEGSVRSTVAREVEQALAGARASTEKLTSQQHPEIPNRSSLIHKTMANRRKTREPDQSLDRLQSPYSMCTSY